MKVINSWLQCVHANVSNFAVYYYIIAKKISFMKTTKPPFKGVKKSQINQLNNVFFN